MPNAEEVVRNVAVLILLGIAFPTVASFVFSTILQGIVIGLIIAVITFIIFLYLSKEY